SKSFKRLSGEVADRVLVGDICYDNKRVNSEGMACPCDFIQRVLASRGKDDGGAALGKLNGGSPPDAARGSGDNRYRALFSVRIWHLSLASWRRTKTIKGLYATLRMSLVVVDSLAGRP